MPNTLIVRSLATGALGALLCSTALAQTISTAVTNVNGGGVINGDDTFTITPGGSIRIGNPTSTDVGVRAVNATGDDNVIVNQGAITVTTSGTGGNIPDGVWVVENPASDFPGIGSYAVGVFANGAGNTIANDGSILVENTASGDLVRRAGFNRGIVVTDANGAVVTNWGNITVTTAAEESGSNAGILVGIVSPDNPQAATITNSGDISITASGLEYGYNLGIRLTLSDSADPNAAVAMDGLYILNSGRIIIVQTAGDENYNGSARGIQSDFGNSNVGSERIVNSRFVNSENGVINISTSGGGNRGIQIRLAQGELINRGVISITSGSGTNRGLQLNVSSDEPQDNSTITNFGSITINADSSSNRGIQVYNPGSVASINHGDIHISSTYGGGNRGIDLDSGAEQVYMLNSGSITLEVDSGGNRGMQATNILAGGSLRAINTGDISVFGSGGYNRGIMVTGGAVDGYVLNSGTIVLTGTNYLQGIMARGVNGTTVNTGSITVTGAGNTRGIESNVNWGGGSTVAGEGNTTIVNRGSVVVRFADNFDAAGFEIYGAPTLSALEVGDYNAWPQDVLTITNSGRASAWGGNAIQVDNDYASAIINLEAGSILIGDVSIDNPHLATINFGRGLNAIVRTDHDDIGDRATINVTDGQYFVDGDTIYVVSNAAGAGASSSAGPTIATVASLSLAALSQRDTLRGPGVQVARGSTQDGPLGWGTLFGRTANGPDGADDVTTRGLILGTDLGQDVGLFFGMANTRTGSTQSDHLFGGLYAAFDLSGLDAELSLTFGRADGGGADMVIADNTIESGLRSVSLGGESSYVMPSITLSEDVAFGQATLTPSLQMSYARVSTESEGFDLGPLSQSGGVTETNIFALRGQIAHNLDEVETETGLLSADMRMGFDAAHVSIGSANGDWEDGRWFIGADLVHTASDSGMEFTGGFELGRTSGGVNDIRAGAGLQMRF